MADKPLSKKDTHDKYFVSKGSLIFVSDMDVAQSTRLPLDWLLYSFSLCWNMKKSSVTFIHRFINLTFYRFSTFIKIIIFFYLFIYFFFIS